jgi:hypothetical protein
MANNTAPNPTPIPKTHQKRKRERALWKQYARDGKIVNAAGQWVNRSSLPDTSMKRDFSPQSGA